MALIINNNMLAMTSLGQLNKNIVEKGKRLSRLASGEKIVGAGDGAAEFAISERMQVQLRGLGQDVENTKTGRSMLGVGAGGIEKIVEELRSMKELAINAANDTNTDADRATLQKDFDQRKQDIADIVASTNYNGKLLLDGTYASKRKAFASNDDDDDSAYGPRGATQAAVTSMGPTTAETWPSDGVIQYGGAYTIPDGYTGTITISSTAAAGGVKLSQAGNVLTNVNINVESPASGGSKLWIDNLNITNSTNNSIIQFNGSDNTLTLIGNNTLSQNMSSATAAVVDMGNGLTVQGNGSSLTVNNSGSTTGACIGTDAGVRTSGNLTVINADLILHAYDGASFGSGANGGAVGNITIENSTVSVTGHYFSGIGSGKGNARCGNITISRSTINDLNGSDNDNGHRLGSIDTCIGSGYSNSLCGDIYINSTVVNAANRDSPLIGAGNDSTCANITVSNSDVIGYSTYGAGIGSGVGGSAGNIYIKNATKIQHESLHGAAIGSGQNGHVGLISISPSSLELLDASKAWQDTGSDIPGVGHGDGGTAGEFAGLGRIKDDGEQEKEWEIPGIPLVIHTGTKANQQMRCYIENLGLEALGIKDAELTTQVKATELLGDPHNPEEEGILDKAINYALGEATKVGAYMSRLEQTRDNLITNQENTNSAESTIRDADMAVEMTAMTKANVLTQSAQAMLAQANQTSSNVLSLLQ